MKGLVVDIKDNRAIILKDDGTFANIKNKNYKIGQKVKTSSNAFVNSLKIAACIALCILTSTVAYKFYYTPYSYLYIDINPSVRLDLNYFDIVINCTPLNTDAKFIAVSSGNVEDSINEVITKCEQEGFLTEENNEIEINISKNTDKIRGSVFNVENKYKSTKYNVVVKDATDEESQKANKQGISVKRQRAIEEFSTVFGGDEKENAEKLQDKTTKEIDTLISNKQTEGAEPTVETPRKEEPAPETAQPREPAKRPVKVTPPKQESAPIAVPEKEIEAPQVEKLKEDPPIIEEPEREAKIPEQEQPPQDTTEVVPEDREEPDTEGEITPPDIPEDKPDDGLVEKPIKENQEPPKENMGENIKEPEAENAPPEKEPTKQPAHNDEHQSQPPVKGERTPTSSGVPTNTKQKELPYGSSFCLIYNGYCGKI